MYKVGVRRAPLSDCELDSAAAPSPYFRGWNFLNHKAKEVTVRLNLKKAILTCLSDYSIKRKASQFFEAGGTFLSGPCGNSVQVVIHVVIWAFNWLACPGLPLEV